MIVGECFFVFLYVSYVIGVFASVFFMADNLIDVNPLTLFVAFCPVLHWVVVVKLFLRRDRNGVLRKWIDEYKKIWRKEDGR